MRTGLMAAVWAVFVASAITPASAHQDEEGPFSEATLLTVIDEIMNTETLDHLSIEDQMMVINLVADSIRRYKSIELNKLLDELDSTYNNKKLSDL